MIAREIQITLTRWTCATEGHTHLTRDVAERCIAKSAIPREARIRWTNAKIADVCAAVVKGAAHVSIAEENGVCTGRIGQIYRNGIRRVIQMSGLRKTLPECQNWTLKQDRENATFWLYHIALLRGKPD
jgi:hypothetical protein